MQLSPVVKHGWGLFFDSIKEDTELVGLLGAVVYSGRAAIKETETGTHIFLECPSPKVAQLLITKATFLFVKLGEIFNISRLLISTVADPFYTVPCDNWISLGVYELKPDVFVGVGAVRNKPDWHAVVLLDEDGHLVKS